jgi:hypothetical protein
MTRPRTGRPEPGEFAAYAGEDIARVVGEDAVEALAAQGRDTLALLASLPEERVRGLTYAPGKWTLKEVVGHLADDERIFVYRALCVSRGDPAPLPGFDEKAYVASAGFEARPLTDLLAELAAVRGASIRFFVGLPGDAWTRRGIVNGYSASARGLAFHIAGHELRHRRSLREKYLGLPPG